MNDHNLDDLIIDTPENKGGKAKGFLTIIALFIVVLIVAIILTKIILKDPNADHTALQDNETEMISPELTLQDTPEEDVQDETALSEMIKSEISTPKEEKSEPEAVAKETVVVEEEKVVTKPTPAAKPIQAKNQKTEAKTAKPKEKEIINIPSAVPTPKPAAKSKPTPVPSKSVHEQYFIQVGSFSKRPSSDSRLISALRKQGFHYQIMKINGMHKIMVGPYRSRPDADRAIIRVKDLINKQAFVVKK
ncbi:MAG: SPOR domain-containing protein [Sulfurovum sp.]|nr:SPOR domain-containing protein [Sulfurovum sp.]